jgi:hypothetical protein
LEKHPDLPPDIGEFAFVQPGDGVAIHKNLARVRLHQADEVFQDDALAAARATQDDESLASLDGHVHAGEHGFFSEAFGQFASLDHQAGKKMFRANVSTKFAPRIASELMTTASVGARPTPAAPLVVFSPSWQATVTMIIPKTNALMSAL